MAVNSRLPELALVVDVTTAYFHCAKCIIRSRLWSDEQSTTAVGDDDRLLAEAMVKHGELAISVDEMQEIILNDEAQRLY
jgi:hypothetical protein